MASGSPKAAISVDSPSRGRTGPLSDIIRPMVRARGHMVESSQVYVNGPMFIVYKGSDSSGLDRLLGSRVTAETDLVIRGLHTRELATDALNEVRGREFRSITFAIDIDVLDSGFTDVLGRLSPDGCPVDVLISSGLSDDLQPRSFSEDVLDRVVEKIHGMGMTVSMDLYAGYPCVSEDRQVEMAVDDVGRLSGADRIFLHLYPLYYPNPAYLLYRSGYYRPATADLLFKVLSQMEDGELVRTVIDVDLKQGKDALDLTSIVRCSDRDRGFIRSFNRTSDLDKRRKLLADIAETRPVVPSEPVWKLDPYEVLDEMFDLQSSQDIRSYINRDKELAAACACIGPALVTEPSREASGTPLVFGIVGPTMSGKRIFAHRLASMITKDSVMPVMELDMRLEHILRNYPSEGPWCLILEDVDMSYSSSIFSDYSKDWTWADFNALLKESPESPDIPSPTVVLYTSRTAMTDPDESGTSRAPASDHVVLSYLNSISSLQLLNSESSVVSRLGINSSDFDRGFADMGLVEPLAVSNLAHSIDAECKTANRLTVIGKIRGWGREMTVPYSFSSEETVFITDSKMDMG